jgi:pyruvate ferredoxin oxidoreductase gamma subunit
MMFQVRIHGRGGQGVVTAAELLSVAAFDDGRHAQAFPTFGSERMGAPVTAFCRISEQPIRSREPVAHPDAVVVQDPTLLHHVDLFTGLSLSGYVVLNSSRSPAELGISELADRLPSGHLITVAATDLARTHTGRPLPNAALLGAFAALTGAVSLASVVRAIRERFPGRVGDVNAAAAEVAFAAASDKTSVKAADAGKGSRAQAN